MRVIIGAGRAMPKFSTSVVHANQVSFVETSSGKTLLSVQGETDTELINLACKILGKRTPEELAASSLLVGLCKITLKQVEICNTAVLGVVGPNNCYPDPSELDQGGIDADGNHIE